MTDPRSPASGSPVANGKRSVPAAVQSHQSDVRKTRSAASATIRHVHEPKDFPTTSAAKLQALKLQGSKQAFSAAAKRKRALFASSEFSYVAIYQATPLERIDMIRRGIPASEAKRIFTELMFGQGAGNRALNLSAATVNKKAKLGGALSSEDSERVVGFAKLVGQLEAMIQESGDPAGFDARAWMARWLNEPLPAFGGTRPVDLMDTMEGQGLVSAVLAQVQSGAYA